MHLPRQIRATYRLASQVYEAIDAGFEREEIKELLETSDNAIDYVLRYKSKIAPVIKDALKKLYPSKKVTRPYRTWKLISKRMI